MNAVVDVRRAVTVAAVLMMCLVVPAFAKGEAKKVEAAKAAATQPAAAPKADPAHDAMMEAMLKMGAPGKPHEGLAALAGKWKCTTKSWNGPGEPVVSEGVADFDLILGGRFLQQHYSGPMMGMPYEGYGLTGFDNQSKQYVFSWIDNMGTGLMTGTGSMDEAGKKMTMSSKFMGPDGSMVDARMITELVDPNTQVFTMFGTMGGQEVKMMEITYKRM